METCVGAIILGYPKQEISVQGFAANVSISFPTPWNQIEGALSYALKKPTLVVAHNKIDGGVFDYGITGEFVYKADLTKAGWFKVSAFTGAFNDWKKRI